MTRHDGLALGLVRALLDLILPQCCAGCGGAGGVLCARCGPLLGGPARVRRPCPPPPGLPPPWSVAAYGGPVRSLIVAHKERGRTALAHPLGRALARALSAAAASGAGPLFVVPVPSSRASIRRRGHDPTLHLVRTAVGELRRSGKEAYCLRALAHRRRVADQAGLSAVARAVNLTDAFAVTRSLAGTRVVLADDVVTTGATLAEAAGALRTAGAAVQAAAVIAATPRRR